jgi:hypothetical protein
MCDICKKARKQEISEGLKTIASAMSDRSNQGLDCLDALVGELVGLGVDGQDALDHDTEPLKGVI